MENQKFAYMNKHVNKQTIESQCVNGVSTPILAENKPCAPCVMGVGAQLVNIWLAQWITANQKHMERQATILS